METDSSVQYISKVLDDATEANLAVVDLNWPLHLRCFGTNLQKKDGKLRKLVRMPVWVLSRKTDVTRDLR